MVEKDIPIDPLSTSNEANVIDAKLHTDSPLTKIFKDGTRL